VLDLGSLSPGSDGLIDLTFDLSPAGHVAGDGFAIDLAVADVPSRVPLCCWPLAWL
jgi:hypothetical protein